MILELLALEVNIKISNNIISLLREHAEEHPHRMALKWGFDQAITYKDFADKISFLASGLKALGIEKGDRVLIFAPLSIELYWSMFAVQQLGAIAVFLDSWARAHQLGLCCDIAQPKAMISTEKAFQIPELNRDFIRILVSSLEGLAAKKTNVQ